ncbi:unnamed protein product [Prorocentrum cordatum]|uniref:Uncharacterized protein n=1 Tax=Prorocentrum cordatum TaxID=2364126 RepID=A0ABN9WTZ5_9DINO|nr:unnamed protein product [Polarella glacialis]
MVVSILILLPPRFSPGHCRSSSSTSYPSSVESALHSYRREQGFPAPGRSARIEETHVLQSGECLHTAKNRSVHKLSLRRSSAIGPLHAAALGSALPPRRRRAASPPGRGAADLCVVDGGAVASLVSAAARRRPGPVSACLRALGRGDASCNGPGSSRCRVCSPAGTGPAQPQRGQAAQAGPCKTGPGSE